MRRTTEQALAGLPAKPHDRRTCDLTPGQAEQYRQLVEARGGPLRQALASPGPVPYLHVFALLSRLKQLCDHPDLLLPPSAPPSAAGSGKWNLLTEILTRRSAAG